ncbi:phospholipid/cholesterol/gamma-HCH transport system substrate-binding protein [Pseudochelatococcus lubricantis]|uniref:Phospholipid/cholesterol/gamma-HCH transport system substrate-binding protein n=1 Tax=Pseudochelatococcus lubricantis TaxID=1538102 RepID=A0ABX0UWK3_9HYPH|nr:MlaD family protein [Pseudochelatococcus lubricantis]NIJ56654.1 phospholipid/cholesterol/gamma-HCH transport system substrate-binding protein [Pseudochelatococcus lubricantis]
METRANYALIGLFTLAVIFAGFFFVYWFSGANTANTRELYRIIFSGSVAGLSRGSLVLFNGLRVGEVVSVELLPEDPRHVVAIASIDRSTPIKQDTRAQLEFQVVTGIASVQLSGGAPDAPQLEAGPGQPLPTLYGERSDFQDMLDTIQRLATRATAMIDQLSGVVEQSREPITNTVRNVEKFSKALGDNSDKVSALLANSGELASQLTGLTSNLDALVKSIEPQRVDRIVDNIEKFTTSLGNSSGDVETVAANAAELTAKLNKAAEGITGLMDSISNFVSSTGGNGAFDQVAEAARSIRTLADNLDKRTAQITSGINSFAGPGLREYQALAVKGQQALAQLTRLLQDVQRNPQQFLFGNRPPLPQYQGQR